MNRFNVSRWGGFTLLLLLLSGSAGWLVAQSSGNGDRAQAQLLEWCLANGYDSGDLAGLRTTDRSVSQPSGVTHVYWQQTLRGIGIHGAVASGYEVPGGKAGLTGVAFVRDLEAQQLSLVPVLSAAQAIERASQSLGLGSAGLLEPIFEDRGPERAGLFGRGMVSQEDIPVKLVVVPLENGDWRLAWELSLLTRAGDHWWNVRVDARNGNLLGTDDWMTECHFPVDREALLMGELDAAPAPLALYAPPPNSYNVFPDPVESPSHGSRQIVSNPADPVASPFGWHDTDGAAGAEFTITRGNNVWAMEDINGNDGVGASPDGGATLDFNFPLNLTNQPNTYTDAAVTNLFFWNNRIHDVLYRYGFDEASGNFQENNYGNGGAGGDYVFADGQDGSGINNANFGTPPDGNNPRMQMFLWNGSSTVFFEVQSPGSIAGFYNAVEAGFGPGLGTTPVTGNLVLANDGSANPTEACNALVNGAAVNGNIAVVDRGNCNFTTKVLNAQAAGATACVVCNNVGTPPFAMGGAAGGITIPSVMISQADCNLIKAQLAGGVTVSMSNSGPAVDKDGDLDNGIIAHEYAHGLSNRLVGGPSNSGCLGNAEQMGEGWSDFLGLIMTMEPGDAGTDGRGIGTYAISQSPAGGGIRPAPYTTDMSVNGFTYADIANTGAISRPHGIGFLFCNMLWEMTWGLTDAIGFDPNLETGTGGNNIALQLVVEGMKLTPCSPGFVDARDAILDADTLLYSGAYSCIIWEAFAKRGLGFSADQGSAADRSDGNEAFDLPPNCIGFPVDWLHLGAEPQGSSIGVHWAVARQVDNRGFEVQRSLSPDQGFEARGFVEGAGSLESAAEYSFDDREVVAGQRYFYRLKQVDLDGSYRFSSVVEAQLPLDEQLEVALLPNPARGRCQVSAPALSGQKVALELTDLQGRVLLKTNWEEFPAGGAPIDLQQLAAGQYLVRVQSGDRVQVERLSLY